MSRGPGPFLVSFGQFKVHFFSFGPTGWSDSPERKKEEEKEEEKEEKKHVLVADPPPTRPGKKYAVRAGALTPTLSYAVAREMCRGGS